MANRRISHARGKGSINHNNRNHVYKNVDPSKIENNIYHAKESLEEAYQKCFGQALENYNSKQKRADRKIDDYYKHLFGNTRKDAVAISTNKEKSFYEIVVGIGDRNTCPVGSADGELAAVILDEYVKGFSKRNPNFYVFNSVMHLDEKTPHLHIDYIPIADGYKNGLETRNSQSVALQKMGFGKEENSINEWRKQERQILRGLCEKHGLEIAEEAKGRGKTFTPDEYKKIRDEAKEELKIDTEVLDEIKDEIRVNFEDELLSEQLHLIDEVAKNKQEVSDLQDEKTTLQNEIQQVRNNITTEQKNFKDIQQKFKPRKEDLKKIQIMKKEAKPTLLTGKITLTKEDWDFIVGIAEQHAKISDTTLAALESQNKATDMLKRCQSLYLAVATEVAALGYSDRSKLTHSVQDVLRDTYDTRVVSWLVDDMVNNKPSDLAEMLEAREVKISKKYNFAKKVQDYNQTNPTPQKVKKKTNNHER